MTPKDYYEKRPEFGKKEYNREEFINSITEAYKYLTEVDDLGSVDFCYARMWKYFNERENILTPEGGI